MCAELTQDMTGSPAYGPIGRTRENLCIVNLNRENGFEGLKTYMSVNIVSDKIYTYSLDSDFYGTIVLN